MILDKHKTIFVHIPKNAGTSIKTIFDKNHVKREGEMPTVHEHKTIHEIKTKNPEEYNFYKKFAIVRNPYDRMVSWYTYLNGYITSNDLLNTYQWNNDSKSYEIVETAELNINGFKEFVKDPVKNGWGRIHQKHLFREQCYWVDETVTILRYENLEKELNKFFEEKINLPIINKSVRNSTLVYYDKKLLDIVYNRYKADFEKFNYEKL